MKPSPIARFRELVGEMVFVDDGRTDHPAPWFYWCMLDVALVADLHAEANALVLLLHAAARRPHSRN